MFIFEAINDIGYFTISFYLSYTIAAIALSVFFVRLLRSFPYYIKHGHLGNSQNLIWLGDDKREFTLMIRHFFTETHPGTIGGDLASVALFTLILHMTWILVPFLIAGRLIWVGVGELANHMRSQYLKKQKFHAALKGD